MIPVSVLVPTVGRVELLRRLLDSLAACHPAPAEILLVDQSDGEAVSSLVQARDDLPLRRVTGAERGIARAMNAGLRAARHPHVLVTHDDCRVAPDWIAVGAELLAGSDDLIVTGMVRPGGDGSRPVPSTKVDPRPRDFTGTREVGALYPNDMGLPRDAVLDLGGFDERLWYAEDNDLCYRWLRAGLRLRYRPELVVTHEDWRSSQELGALWREYWFHQGVFYAKHLRRRDPYMLRLLGRDAYQMARYVAARALGRTTRLHDERSGIATGLPRGLAAGWRRFARAA